MPSDRCPAVCLYVCSVCNVGVLWPNGWTDQDETWPAGRPRPWPHYVRLGPTSPSPKGHSSQFLAYICCGQMAEWIKMSLGIDLRLGPGDFVLDGEPASSTSPKRGGAPPQFLAHVCCGQTAGWIKMPLGMEVGLGPGHTVLDANPAPSPKKGESPPIFGPFVLWQNGWMD